MVHRYNRWVNQTPTAKRQVQRLETVKNDKRPQDHYLHQQVINDSEVAVAKRLDN